MKKRTSQLTCVILMLCTAQLMSQSIPRVDHHGFGEGHKLDPRMEALSQELPSNSIYSSSIPEADGDAPIHIWSGQFGGSVFDEATDVITDTDGNIYMSGNFSGTMGIETYSWNSVGERDAFVAKFDASGSLLWLKQLSPSAGEFSTAMAICLADDNNLFVTGSYSGNIQLGPVNLSPQGAASLYVTQLNAAGDILSAWRHDSFHESEQGIRIDIDQAINIYVIGNFQDDYGDGSILLKFDLTGSVIWEQEHDEDFLGISIGGSAISLTGQYDQGDDRILDPDVSLPESINGAAFVSLADLNGDFLWASAPGHLENTWGSSIGQSTGVDDTGNLFMAGRIDDNAVFGEDTLYANRRSGFIAKYNPTGTLLWVTQLPEIYELDSYTDGNGVSHVALSNMIAKIDSDGTILWTEESLPSPTAITQHTSGKILTAGDVGLAFVSQHDSMGLQEWVAQFSGNSGIGNVIGMVSDQSSNLYTCGWISNVSDYFGQSISEGIFICKQDNLGNVVWLNHYPGAMMRTNLMGDQLHIDTVNQALFLAGTILNTLDIPGHTQHIPQDENNLVVMKLDLDGNYILSFQEDFDYQYDFEGVIADRSGNIIVSGLFYDTIFIAGQELISAGERDGFIAKYDPSGISQWAVRSGGDGIEWVATISSDASDNIYLTGEYTSENVTVGTTPFTMLEGDGNVILAKLNPTGEVQWIKALASTQHEWRDAYCWPTGIRVSPDSSVYIKGSMRDTAYFDNILLTSPFDGYNKFITKTDSDGNVLWADIITQGRSGNYWFDYNQFDIDPGSNVYFGGQARDTMDLGTELQYIPSSFHDVYVAKYSSDGTPEWVTGLRGSASVYTWSKSVAVNGSGNVYMGIDLTGEFFLDDANVDAPNRHGFIAMLGPDGGECEVPAEWVVNPADFEFNGQVTAKVFLHDVAAESGWLAAFVGDECRSMPIEAGYFPPGDHYVFELICYSDSASGETLTFKYFDDVNCEILEPFTESVEFVPDMTVGNAMVPFELHYPGEVLYHKDFVSGWTWFSVNVLHDDMSLANLLGCVVDGDYIKSQTQSAQFYDGFGWYGSLEDAGGLDPTSLYKIRAVDPCVSDYMGLPVDVTITPINIVSGWNWIGYLPQDTMPIADALASLTLEENDYIKNQVASATYYDGFGWYGALEDLLPTDGYMIRKASADILTYPENAPASQSAKKAVQGKEAPGSAFDPHQFEFNGSVTARVFIDGSPVGSEEDMVMAYVDDQLRGVIGGIYFDPTESFAYPLMVYSNVSEGETLTFKYYDAEKVKLYPCEGTLVFYDDMIEANAFEPFELHVKSAGVEDDPYIIKDLSLEAFPNPFKDQIHIEYSVPEMSRVKITVYDMLGREVEILEEKTLDPGSYSIVWNAESQPEGAYFLKLITDESYAIKKVSIIR